MTDSAGTRPDASYEARPPLSKIVWSLLRAVGSTAVVVTIYYLLPLDHSSAGLGVTTLIAGLVLFLGLLTYQIRAIMASAWPGLRALEALSISVPLFLLLFASTYVVMAVISAANFSAPMTHTNGLYFTVTVFATVGFGDITAKTEAARLVVTVQMMLDLLILGLGAKVILSAVTRGRERRAGSLPGDGAERPGRRVRVTTGRKRRSPGRRRSGDGRASRVRRVGEVEHGRGTVVADP